VGLTGIGVRQRAWSHLDVRRFRMVSALALKSLATKIRTEYVVNCAAASSLFMLLIIFCWASVKLPDDRTSAGNAKKLARYLSIAATLPT